ncbi:MAG: histidine kinase, partial [Deltaproteobacteria bacterium]
ALVVEVVDHGCGIDPEHMARLTDPFFTTRRESGGTGLGLSVSAGIVEEHGGRLEFASRPGEGTRVRVILPLEKEAS